MPPIPTSAPSQTDFLASFGAAPVEAVPEDGFWAYEFDGPSGTRVRLSYNTHDGSVQTACLIEDRLLAVMVCEGAKSIRIGEDERIHVAFSCQAGMALTITVFPVASVEWASMR